jgi:iron complex outermembrane recepter protein
VRHHRKHRPLRARAERASLLASAVGLFWATPSKAQEAIIITATRTPESELTTPVAESVVSGQSIRQRGATDLRGALSPVAGVEVLPGSDAGPAGSVLAFQGLTEMDAYLLVVDGVPLGGAFNPATSLLDLIDVDRVEVVRGSAPVSYGATSFVGVVHVIRPEAGQQPTRGLLQLGTRRSGRASFATTISTAPFGQSLLGSVEQRGFSQDRGKFDRAHVLYRAATDLGSSRLHIDLEGVTLDQTPYSSHPREGSGLSSRFPLDANVNPSDARQDQDRLQANAGYESQLGGLQWSTLVSAAKSWGRNVRGFLREDFDASGLTVNADGFRQRVQRDELYADTNLSEKREKLDWVMGVDWLHGSGRQRSRNFEYAVEPDGSNAPASTSLNIDESTVLTDRRDFTGIYGQIIARPNSALTLLAGIRLNHTRERRCGGEDEGADTPSPDECERLNRTRLSGSVGASYRLWHSGQDALIAFVDYRNTFKPAAIDFGPEAESEILTPETADGWEAGVKGQLAKDKLWLEASYFDTHFNNLVIRENIDGLPGLANAGRERFRGFETELRWTPTASVLIGASYAHHLAKFVDYARLRPDGSIQQLAGKRLELSPKNVASFGASYAQSTGPQASVTLRYVGSRFLNKANTVKAKGYTVIDGRMGWRLQSAWGLFLEAENLTDRRDPVTESELGEAQFYRLPGRRIFGTISYRY